MTTYKTGNPIGSTAVKDLYDNAENLDTAVNDTSRDTWSDRLGQSRKTMSGMERQFDAAEDYRETTFVSTQADKQSRFNDFIASSGYQFLGDYATGIEITEYNQIVRDVDGEFWRLSGQVELPYTTTGAGLPEGEAFIAVGDAALRQELDLNLINLLGYYNVRSYGAVGDGVADDRAAIQAAVDSAALSGGGVVFLPAGTYRITAQINWKTKVSLKGMGAGISIIKMDGVLFDAIKNTEGGSVGDDPNIPSLDDCHFEDFEIDGSGLTHTEGSVSGKGIFINFMRRAVFRNLYIHHTIGTGLGCDFHEDSVIDSCVVTHCGRNFGIGGSVIGQSGIGIGSGWKERDYLTITNCFTNFNGNYGIFLEIQSGGAVRDYNAQGTRISNCYSYGNRIGFGNRHSGGITFSDCQAIANTEEGFLVNYSRRSYNVLSACRAEDNGTNGFSFANTGAHDQLTGCVSLNNGEHGYYIQSAFYHEANLGGVGATLSQCQAIGNAGSGVHALFYEPTQVYSSVKLNGCWIKESGGAGLFVSRVKNLYVKASEIESSGERGVNITNLPPDFFNSISGCDIKNNTGSGIRAGTTAGGGQLYLSDNRVLDNEKKGGGLPGVAISVTGSQPVIFKATNNVVGGSEYSTDYDIGIYHNLSHADSIVYAIGNDLTNNVNGVSGGADLVRGNTGYNYSNNIATTSTPASPATFNAASADRMFYFAGDDLAATIDGGTAINASGSLSVFVPAGSELGLTYTGSVSTRIQRL